LSKNTKRNYVSEIQINNINYIFKEPRNEYIIPQRKLFTLFKNGEALTTVINVNKAIIEDNLIEYAKPFLAIVKRKNGMICYSALIQEKINVETDRNLDKMIEITKKIHSKGYYHGDCNPSNFITSEDEVKILDTQAKKMNFGNYRAHYDMLTMQIDSYPNMKYPYKKNIFYYFALFIKKFKENLPDRDIWIWSGFTWEEILEDENRFSLIKECDVLIDGKFVDSLKDLNLKWKGSSNQRVIDIKKSLEKNEVIEYI